MATVRMLAGISGTRDGVDWPKRGELLTVDSAEAEHLVSARLAEIVDDAPARKPVETAAIDPVVETAAAPAPKKRRA